MRKAAPAALPDREKAKSLYFLLDLPCLSTFYICCGTAAPPMDMSISVTATAAGRGGASMVTRSTSAKAVGPAAIFAAIVLAAGSARASPLLEEAVGAPPGGGGAPSPKAGGPHYTTLLSDVSTAFTTFQAGKHPSLGHHRSVFQPAPPPRFDGSTGFFV